MIESGPELIYSNNSSDEIVEIWQDADRRWLVLEDGLIQSEILVNEPGVLPSVLNRAMLAGFMFSHPPGSILLAGTGGGATARFINQLFPQISGVAIEKSSQVAEVALNYFDFPAASHWELKIEDVAHYVVHSERQFDVILVDIALHQSTPDWIVEVDFLQACRNRLSPGGHLSLNLLVNDPSRFLECLGTIREVFERRTLCLSLPENSNTLIMAFNQEPPFPPPVAKDRLDDLEKLYSLEFAEFYQRMQNDNPPNSGVF